MNRVDRERLDRMTRSMTTEDLLQLTEEMVKQCLEAKSEYMLRMSLNVQKVELESE